MTSSISGTSIECINPDAPEYNKVSEFKAVEWSHPRRPYTKTVDIEYYNTLEQFVLRVKSSHAIADVLVDDESIKDFDGTVSAGDWQEFALDLEEGWEAGDTKAFKLQIAGFGPPVSFEVEYTLLGECAGCNDAGWILQLTGPTEAPFFAKGSMFRAAWTHESADPACEAPNDVAYAWTMNGDHLSSSSTAEIPARGYAGGIYSASRVETVVEFTATVGTSPAVTAERILRPRSTTPISVTANAVQSPDCQDAYCELTSHAVFYNPDGDDENLVFDWLCSASGGIAGQTYCNRTFTPNDPADWFPTDQTGRTAFLFGRVAVWYNIHYRVRKAYEDPADPASWSRYSGPSWFHTWGEGDVSMFGHIMLSTDHDSPPTSVVINEGDQSIGVGGTFRYTVSVNSTSTTNTDVTWSICDVSHWDSDSWNGTWEGFGTSSRRASEDMFCASFGTEGAATVAPDGTVTGVAEGLAVISAVSSSNPSRRYSVIVSVRND